MGMHMQILRDTLLRTKETAASITSLLRLYYCTSEHHSIITGIYDVDKNKTQITIQWPIIRNGHSTSEGHHVLQT